MTVSILIAIPCYGGVMSDKTAQGLFDLGKNLEIDDIEHSLLTVSNQSLIPKARSDIANYFMNNTDFSHLMWIDADLGFQAMDVYKLLEMNVEHATATYRHKTLKPFYSFEIKMKEGKIDWNNNKTAFKITHNVGGFSLIKRSVFDKIQRNIQHLRYIPQSNSRTLSEAEINNSYHYYETPLVDGNLLPEDFAFQQKCMEAGIDIWLRPDIRLVHSGTTDFEGIDLESILKE